MLAGVEARRSAFHQDAPFDYALPRTGKAPLRVLASPDGDDCVSPVVEVSHHV